MRARILVSPLAYCLLAGGLLSCSDPSAPISVASVSIESERRSGDFIQLDGGERYALAARVLDGNGRVLLNQRVTWLSSRPQIAAIDSTGMAVAGILLSPDYDGTTITASVGGRTDTVTILVVPSRPATIDPLPDVTLAPGMSIRLTPVIRDVHGNILSGWNIPGYESSDPSLASVDAEGTLRAYAHPGPTSRQAEILLVGRQREFYGSFKVTVPPL